MDVGFSEDQELLRKTARDVLAEHAPMAHVRKVMDGPEPFSADAWGKLGELGWPGLVFPERFGGANLGDVELALVVEALGRALTPVPFLPTLLGGRAILEVGDDAQQEEWLTRIAQGAAIATLAITEERGTEEPGDLQLAARSRGDGWELAGTKLFVPDAAAADVLVVVARTGGEGERGLGLFLVPRECAGLAIAPQASMDRLRPLYEARFDGVRVPGSALLGGDRDAWPRLRRVLDRGRVMICAEMVGGAEKCLEDAVRYARERSQFGKPIGANQAIKHKCADVLYVVESARSITYYAAWAAGEDEREATLAAAMAKAYVGEAFRRAAAENIQIHGGVGFTWETDCHLYFKRAASDDVWLGDSRHHRERVAALMDL